MSSHTLVPGNLLVQQLLAHHPHMMIFLLNPLLTWALLRRPGDQLTRESRRKRGPLSRLPNPSPPLRSLQLSTTLILVQGRWTL
ncbi:hypothetical protein BJ165DRAFT_1476151, partial [Panaeolus papilionaceus]